MEDIVQIKENIKNYIKSAKKYNIPEENIGVDIKKIGGLSNINYSAIVKNVETDERIVQLLYRKFGALSDSVNHELEITIIKYLANKGYGPKLLHEVPGDYRLSEYLVGTTSIPKEKGLDKSLLDKLIHILNLFTSISYTYRYKANGDQISLIPIDDGIKEKRIEVNKNQYLNCMVDWLEKARTVYKKFTDQFRLKYSKEKHQKEWADVELVQHYLDNFKEYFLQNFPSKGFFVLNHNDTHRLNLLLRKKDQKLFLIDQEFAFLNLPGNDMANYLNEVFFNYEPDYYCSLDKLDFNKTYMFYEKFIEQFIQGHKFLEKQEGGKEFLKTIKTKKYFIQLTNIINLYFFLWSFCYTDFAAWDKDHYGEYYFVHGVDRIKFYLAGMKEIEKIKNKN